MYARVIILNSDYTYINMVSWQKAFKIMAKGKASVVKYSDKVIQVAENLTMRIPAVMKLMKIVRIIYKNKVPFSKRNVMIRDNFHCVYCGVEGVKFTIDHVKPKSKGGKSTFENCVTSCKPCNLKKGDKLCSEIKMYPRTNLTAPTISEFLMLKMKSLGIDKFITELWT
jgi:5-methylcytosine-specific restriction endonuclease McrA